MLPIRGWVGTSEIQCGDINHLWVCTPLHLTGEISCEGVRGIVLFSSSSSSSSSPLGSGPDFEEREFVGRGSESYNCLHVASGALAQWARIELVELTKERGLPQLGNTTGPTSHAGRAALAEAWRIVRHGGTEGNPTGATGPQVITRSGYTDGQIIESDVVSVSRSSA